MSPETVEIVEDAWYFISKDTAAETKMVGFAPKKRMAAKKLTEIMKELQEEVKKAGVDWSITVTGNVELGGLLTLGKVGFEASITLSSKADGDS